jgi:LuxR family maltose regulon positive regulatory protein
VSPVTSFARAPVNTHIRQIYTKLGATDRSSAVQRGRELRLRSSGRT